MADPDVVWPVGTTDRDPDLADRPLVFDPKGFLVGILPGAHEAGGAATALRGARRSTHRRPGTDRALPRPRPGRVLRLWVHTADDDVAKRAIRALADSPALHIRHYGHRRQSDFYVQRPTS